MCSESHTKATSASGANYHCKLVSEAWSSGPLVRELQLRVSVHTSPGKETATFFGSQSKTGTLFKGNYRLHFYAVAEAAIMSCSIHSGQQLRFDAFPHSMEEFEIEEGYPDVVFPVLREHVAVGICHTPGSLLLSLTIGLTFTLCRHQQKFPIEYNTTTHRKEVEISFLRW